jgi:hypothetical protein
MFLRMKAKYFAGLRKSDKGSTSLTKYDPVLIGCHDYERRKALKDQYDQGLFTEDQYDAERRKILRPMTDAPPIIKMELHHGHMVVMNGQNLQKYYEVSFHSSLWKLSCSDSLLAQGGARWRTPFRGDRTAYQGAGYQGRGHPDGPIHTATRSGLQWGVISRRRQVWEMASAPFL